MSKEVKMSKLERQLRLYKLLLPCAIAELSEIFQAVFPYNMRLLQRDLADLRDAGLVEVKYSRKGKNRRTMIYRNMLQPRIPIMNCFPACQSGRFRFGISAPWTYLDTDVGSARFPHCI